VSISYPTGYLARGYGISIRSHKRDMRIEMLNRTGWRDELEPS
jgi:hypothetical protein